MMRHAAACLKSSTNRPPKQVLQHASTVGACSGILKWFEMTTVDQERQEPVHSEAHDCSTLCSVSGNLQRVPSLEKAAGTPHTQRMAAGHHSVGGQKEGGCKGFRGSTPAQLLLKGCEAPDAGQQVLHMFAVQLLGGQVPSEGAAQLAGLEGQIQCLEDLLRHGSGRPILNEVPSGVHRLPQGLGVLCDSHAQLRVRVQVHIVGSNFRDVHTAQAYARKKGTAGSVRHGCPQHPQTVHNPPPPATTLPSTPQPR